MSEIRNPPPPAGRGSGDGGSDACPPEELAGLQRLYALHSRLAGEADLQISLRDIVCVAAELSNSDRGTIQLASENGPRLELFAHCGYHENSPFIRHLESESGGPVFEAARRERRRIVIEDVESFAPLAGTTALDAAREAGVRAIGSTPLFSRDGHLLGLLSVHYGDVHRPTEHELRMLDLLSWTAVDYIERHHASAGVRRSEDRFKALVTAGAVSIYRMSPDWTLMYRLDSHDFLENTPEPIADWADQYILAEDREGVFAAVTEAIAKRSMFELEHRVRLADGTIGWVLSRAVPMMGLDGQIAEWFGAGTDVTTRKRAEAALRDSEAKYKALFESMDEAFAVVEVLKDATGNWADFRFLEVNPAFMAHTAMPYPVGKTATELLGTPNPHWAQMYGEALDSGTPLRVEETEWTLGRTFDLNIFALDRQRSRVAVLFTNITDRKRTEEALRESEERLRQFGEASSDLLWIRDAESLRFEYLSPAFDGLYGVGRDEMLRGNDVEAWLELLHPDDRDKAVEGLRALREGVPHSQEYRVVQPNGTVLWLHNTDFPVLDAQGKVQRIAGIAQDVTQRKRAVELQTTLLAELQHRVRNILALIRSIVRRSNEGERSAEDYVQHLEGRISALARTQVLLTRRPGAGVDLEEIVRDELLAQAASDDQIVIAGPDVLLAPKAAEVLTLALHELATNATKYGAFSRSTGRVEIGWNVVRRGDEDWLTLKWVEQGVPIVSPEPIRRGFGAELISRRIPYELAGNATFELRPGGLRSEIEFPLRFGESILQTNGGSR